MKRYHRQVYFPLDIDLNDFVNQLNNMDWQYSKHCLDNIKYRVIDIKKLLIFIKDLTLNEADIFEYYFEKEIEKACFRINYIKDIDIILVVSKEKNIITIYINEKNDKHITLKKELYCKN